MTHDKKVKQVFNLVMDTAERTIDDMPLSQDEARDLRGKFLILAQQITAILKFDR